MFRVMVIRQRAGLCAVLLLSALALISFASPAFAGKGDKDFKAGYKAEARRDWDEALRYYQAALAIEPDNPQYLLAVGRARFQASVTHLSKGEKLFQAGNYTDALKEFEQAATLDPSNDSARQQIARTRTIIDRQKNPSAAQPAEGTSQARPGMQPGPSRELEEAMGPPVLKPLSRTPINLRMTNESRVIFETIGKLSGINVLFDSEFQSKRITVELNNESLENALDEAGIITKTFWKPLTQNTIMIMPDTAVKRREQEEQVIRTFYLSNPITPQELTEAVTAIRSLLETRRIQQINSLNAIIIRDTPDKVAIAEKIIRDIDKAKPEIVVDVAVIEARRDKSQQLGIFPVSGQNNGIQLPVTFTGNGVTSSGTGTGTDTGTGTGTGTGTATATGTLPLSRLGRLSTNDFSVTLPGATLNALLSDATSKVLQRPEVRATDGQKATLRIGNRVPVATGSFQPGIGGVGVNPLVNTQFQYIDVGVNMDITPKVHQDNEISLKVRIEVSQVTNTTNIGGIDQPVIGQRIIDHDIRLREGEINILGGLMQTQTTKTVSGVPGLAQIPLLKYLFSNTNNTLAEDEVFIVLTPHAVRLPDFSALNIRTLDVGTEGDVHLRSAGSIPEASPTPAAASAPSLVPVPTPGPAAALAPAAIPAPAGVPVVPGGGIPVAVSSATRVRLLAPELVQKVGETFQVPVQADNVKEATGASVEITFDTALVKLTQVTSGNLLGRDGQAVAVVQHEDQQSGKTVVTLSRPPATAGITGDGTLAILTFQAAHAGTSPLSITATAMNSAQRQSVPMENAKGSITIH